ncbi:10062_t:CDS:2 [Rhizophagus irregularis]|nr:10062_t:CDS:2 [Rhizophagus irregularis]
MELDSLRLERTWNYCKYYIDFSIVLKERSNNSYYNRPNPGILDKLGRTWTYYKENGTCYFKKLS